MPRNSPQTIAGSSVYPDQRGKQTYCEQQRGEQRGPVHLVSFFHHPVSGIIAVFVLLLCVWGCADCTAWADVAKCSEKDCVFSTVCLNLDDSDAIQNLEFFDVIFPVFSVVRRLIVTPPQASVLFLNAFFKRQLTSSLCNWDNRLLSLTNWTEFVISSTLWAIWKPPLGQQLCFHMGFTLYQMLHGINYSFSPVPNFPQH